jgi:predicted alpha/beta-hydrolase family hydrolase
MLTSFKVDPLQIAVTPEISVSGSVGIPVWWPSGHRVGIVLGHDVGSNMEQESLVTLHTQLVERGFLTLLFNFPYAERGRKRPDPPPLLERAFRAAAASLLRDPQRAPARLFFGGIGLGARVATQVVAQGQTADGLICLSYPLHPSGKPNQQKAEYLFRIIYPMLFVQGSRDPYCRIDRLQGLLKRVGAPTSLHVVEDADHGLGLIKRTYRTQEELREEVLTTVYTFVQKTLGGL